jgi:hypothetical protein
MIAEPLDPLLKFHNHGSILREKSRPQISGSHLGLMEARPHVDRLQVEV